MNEISIKQRLILWTGIFLPAVCLFLLVLGIWQGIASSGRVKKILLPAPSDVYSKLMEKRTTLIRATLYTGAIATSGFLSSIFLGTVIAIAFSQSKFIRAACYPYVIFLQTVPIVAIAPIIIRWLDFGFQSIVAISLILSLFPIIANVTNGLLGAPVDLRDLFRLHHATRWQILWKLELPHAIPALCVGASTAAGLSVVGAIVGEFFAGYQTRWTGLGYLIQHSSDTMSMDELFATIFMSTLLGLFMFGTVSLISQSISAKWYSNS